MKYIFYLKCILWGSTYISINYALVYNHYIQALTYNLSKLIKCFECKCVFWLVQREESSKEPAKKDSHQSSGSESDSDSSSGSPAKTGKSKTVSKAEDVDDSDDDMIGPPLPPSLQKTADSDDDDDAEDDEEDAGLKLCLNFNDLIKLAWLV